jgi:ectoine hydroxylase-related dioxygenase (phytanoyl-CoA dioxygenase family)
MTTTTEAVMRERSVAQGFSASEMDRFQRAFARDGYVLIKDVLSKSVLKELCDTILVELDKATRSGALFNGGGGISGHLNCSPGEASRPTYDALVSAGVIDVVKAVAPKSQGIPNVGCNVNLPGSVAQHYHADGLFTEDFIVLNVALLDTTLVNGAIDVLPGTHKKFYKYWRFALERASRLSTRLPMSQGDVLIRTSNLWHRGMPNGTAQARPMLCLRWDNRGNPQDYDPFRDNDGKVLFQPNWYKPNFLGRVRERTFVTAPVTYSAYRFVTSLYGNKGYSSW